jgi:hypothetical protein
MKSSKQVIAAGPSRRESVQALAQRDRGLLRHDDAPPRLGLPEKTFQNGKLYDLTV